MVTNKDRALSRVQDLHEHGVPVVICRPGRGDVVPPSGWQNAEVDHSVLDRYDPNSDTFAMVTGHGVDVIDLDAKTGVDLSDWPLVAEYGMDRTPGGGWHIPVPSTGFGRGTLLLHGKTIGDYLGGTPTGGSRGLCYLPGSNRGKYPGLDYEPDPEWDLDKLIDCEPDETLCSILSVSKLPTEGDPGVPAGTQGDVLEFLKDHAEVQNCRYGQSAVDAILIEANAAGMDHAGRHGWATKSISRIIALIKAGCLSSLALIQVQEIWEEIKPEAGADELQRMIAWSITNVKAAASCDHRRAVEAPAGATGGWAAVDLAAIIANPNRQEATLMPRTDGQGLLYPGLVHSIYGHSESFKSGLALAESARLINEEKHVLYIDFESDPHSIVARLLDLGARQELVAEHFSYVRPETGIPADQQVDPIGFLPQRPYTLAVVDGVTEAVSLSGGDSNNADSIARIYGVIPKAIADRFGCAVVLIDHAPKSEEAKRFAFGSQHKLAGLTGAAYLSVPITSLAPGHPGEINLLVTKDRVGGVRAAAGPYDTDSRTQPAARVRLVPTKGGKTEVIIGMPEGSLDPHLLGQMSGWLARQGRPVPQNEILAVFRSGNLLAEALYRGGFVDLDNDLKYVHVKHFVAGVDPVPQGEDK